MSESRGRFIVLEGVDDGGKSTVDADLAKTCGQAKRQAYGLQIVSRRQSEVAPYEICVVVRSSDELTRARRAMEATGIAAVEIDRKTDAQEDRAAIVTMYGGRKA